MVVGMEFAPLSHAWLGMASEHRVHSKVWLLSLPSQVPPANTFDTFAELPQGCVSSRARPNYRGGPQGREEG